jgi:CRP-like cAMP-binding protein
MSSLAVFHAFLEARASFSAHDFVVIDSVMTPRSLPAGEFLQRAGDVATHAAFVAKGCMRSYSIDAKGKEHIVMFAPETWWLADGASLMGGTPSSFFFQALEDTDLLLIDSRGHTRLITEVPGYAEAFQSGIQRHTSAKDRRIVSAMSATPEERYLDFLERYPSIAMRVPQFMLASYLGITPETLSRIRKKLSRPKRKPTSRQDA